MAANGYGKGNLPMDLYKMVYHNNWDYNGRADGQGDYTSWGINKIRVIHIANTNDGRDIMYPDRFVKSISPDANVYWCSGGTVAFGDGGFYWSVDGDGSLYPDNIVTSQGGDDWDYYD